MQGHILGCTFCKRPEQQVRKLVAAPGSTFATVVPSSHTRSFTREGLQRRWAPSGNASVGGSSASSATERARCSAGQVSTPSNKPRKPTAASFSYAAGFGRHGSW